MADEKHELQSRSWLPELPLCIDDVITDLTNATSNREEARGRVYIRKPQPEGEGLEEDIGYIQCEPPRKELVEMLQVMKSTASHFHGHVYRDKALLITIFLQVGTLILERMLKNRESRISARYNEWQEKSGSFTLEEYSWRHLKPVEKGHLYYKFNFYTLDPTIRARLTNIKDEYGLPLGFVAQMAILEAARMSRSIPKWLKDLMDKEHEDFRKWLHQKEAVEALPIPQELPQEGND